MVTLGLGVCPGLECLEDVLNFGRVSVLACADNIAVLEVLLEQIELLLRLGNVGFKG